MTEKFEEVTVDILEAGDSIIIPPGYIHAVISITTSSLVNLNIFCQNWVGEVKALLRRELEFCKDLKDVRDVDFILGRREKDFLMFMELLENVEGNLQEGLKDLLEQERKSLDAIRSLEVMKGSRKMK